MQPTTVPAGLLDTVRLHIPPGSEWIPLAGAALMLIVGLIFMLKGAKLAPALSGVVFGAAGAVAGSTLAQASGIPLWPLLIVGTAIGIVVGVLLFRIWFALLVAGSLIFGSLGLYGHRVLLNPLRDYLAGVAPDGTSVSLPDPAPEFRPWHAALADLWTYLGQHVPTFQASFLAIVITTGLAGLIFALLLPKAARAFWAATMGVGLFLPAVYTILHAFHPGAERWLENWGLLVAAALWSGSLLYNLADVMRPKPRPASQPQPKPA